MDGEGITQLAIKTSSVSCLPRNKKERAERKKINGAAGFILPLIMHFLFATA